jgi:hypothetical protein
VIVQDTGFPAVIPVGEGVFAFDTLEQAAAAIEEVQGNYKRHAKAAREIAEEYFDSGKVLTGFVQQAMRGDIGRETSLDARGTRPSLASTGGTP